MPYTVSSQKRTHADNTNLMVQINGVVNEYIEIEQQVDGLTSSCQVDIGKIDFDLLYGHHTLLYGHST